VRAADSGRNWGAGLRKALALVAISFALLVPGRVEAQVDAGLSGAISDIRGGTFGVAARLAVAAYSGAEWEFTVEGVGDLFFPPCDAVECDMYGLEFNLLAERRYARRYAVYFGVGAIYENATLEQDGSQVFEGDDWGLNLLLGNRLPTATEVEPFFEIRLSLMQELTNQVAFAAGIRVPLGGG